MLFYHKGIKYLIKIYDLYKTNFLLTAQHVVTEIINGYYH